MYTAVTFRTPSGSEVSLVPGDVLGRIPCAVLQIDDPRISEAHAFVSMRGATLKLLSLRGRLSVDGKPRTEVNLYPGLRVVLAGYYGLEVVAIELPSKTLAVVGEADTPLDPVPAQGTVSFFDRELEPVSQGFHAEAVAVLWSSPGGIVLRTIDPTSDRRLAPGDRFAVGRARYRLESMPTSHFESMPTTDRGVADTALTLKLFFDAVHVSADASRVAVLTGIAANAISELAEIGQPVAWQELARQLWPGVSEEVTRSRWDQLTARIRMKLREAGLRSDLIRPTRDGLVQLVLGPRDTLEWSHERAG